LLLSTLHTNDAPSAIARLVDMRIEPYLLSGAVCGVVAQRLVRKICPHCATGYVPDAVALADAGLPPGTTLTRGSGCEQCNKSGFHGRVGIYEVMEITPELRTLIHQRVPSEVLRHQWQKQGGLTLREEGLLLAKTGKTTLEEVLGATQSDGGAPGRSVGDAPAPLAIPA
jgi:type IV pilus assembly protein PilB